MYIFYKWCISSRKKRYKWMWPTPTQLKENIIGTTETFAYTPTHHPHPSDHSLEFGANNPLNLSISVTCACPWTMHDHVWYIFEPCHRVMLYKCIFWQSILPPTLGFLLHFTGDSVPPVHSVELLQCVNDPACLSFLPPFVFTTTTWCFCVPFPVHMCKFP